MTSGVIPPPFQRGGEPAGNLHKAWKLNWRDNDQTVPSFTPKMVLSV